MSNQELSLSPALAQVMKRLVANQQQITRARPQVDLQCIAQWLKNFPEEAKRIGRAGWTIPMWASPAEVSHILEAATKRPIDDVFLDYYQVDGGANYSSLKLYLRRRVRSLSNVSQHLNVVIILLSFRP